MKLYAYEHCPYCVRARMIFGLKNLPLETVYLANDDEATPIGLVGKKVVPILIKEDGTPMAESLDIVRYIDQHYGEPLLSETVRPEIEAWIKKLEAFYTRLLIPRFIRLGVAEFERQSAVDYFVKKKTENIGSFEENLAKSDEYIARTEPLLEELAGLIKAENALNGSLSPEDIMVFPMLRNLTCVKGLHFPQAVADYVQKMAEQSKIDLYACKAI